MMRIRKSDFYRKLSVSVFYLAVMLLVGSLKIDAQASSSKDGFDSPTQPLKCEEWHLFLGEAILEWEKEPNTFLIVIVRLGNGEFSRKLNLRRIKTLKDALSTAKLKGSVVFAEGERVTGYGVIELYVRGKLFHSLPLMKKKDVAEGCQSA